MRPRPVYAERLQSQNPGSELKPFAVLLAGWMLLALASELLTSSLRGGHRRGAHSASQTEPRGLGGLGRLLNATPLHKLLPARECTALWGDVTSPSKAGGAGVQDMSS